VLPAVVRQVPHGFFSLFLPDECRICKVALHEFTRVPICAQCLKSPSPIAAEYFCVSCRTPIQNALPLDKQGRCRLCRSSARGFDTAYCFGTYEGPLRELIHLFKYRHMKPLTRTFAGYLASVLLRDQVFELATPMPMHWHRRWQRGFNQSELLARATARHRGMPIVNAVRRVRATAVQAGPRNTRRGQNVAGAFQVKKPKAVAGRRVLLIDDVMTTRATASACAFALKRAGGRSVTLLTPARVDRRLVEPYNQVSGEVA
jgi:ComF family protein